jgi:hypothetical protein
MRDDLAAGARSSRLAAPPSTTTAEGSERRGRRQLLRASVAVSVCSLVYALYRGFYGLGGTIGMIGTPTSESNWRATNLGAAGVLLLVGLLPFASLPLSRRPTGRRLLLIIAWGLATGGVMHALIMDIQRVASLTGLHQIHYPATEWRSRNNHAADLQDLFFNETWFLLEGILWGILGWIVAGRSRGGHRWLAGALVAVAALTCVGVLSAFGLIGRVIVA